MAEELEAALPERREEGRRDGDSRGFDEGKSAAYEGDLARGRAEGDKLGWDQTYPVVYGEASTRAYNEVVAYFSANAVLRFDGAVTAEANSDGVYAPGETVTVSDSEGVGLTASGWIACQARLRAC